MKMTDNKKTFSETDSLKYRPHLTEKNNKFTIKREHYSTSLDPRGYIPVYEYEINNQPIMWDRETGYIHFTGIWKALGNAKSEIVKMVDANPNLGTKKIRGGYLRIQGTWIPYDYAYLLCKRTAWKIRTELVPIFGPKFPSEALPPSHEDHGCLLLDNKGVKSSSHQKRNNNTTVRQHPKNSKPYSKSSHTKSKPACSSSSSSSASPYTRKTALKSKPMKSCNSTKKRNTRTSAAPSFLTPTPTTTTTTTTTPVLSVSQLLNVDDSQLSTSEEDTESDVDDDLSVSSLSSFYSSALLPSPTFRVIQTYPTAIPSPAVPSPAAVLGSTSVSQDIIDTISATILLQRLSQDDGARPFRPLVSSYIPSKVIVGHQEFTICWD